MNILFLCRLFHPHIGGVEKHVLELSKILMKKGHRIIVVTEKHQNNLKSKEKIEGIEVYRIPDLRENWFKKFQIWWWMWKNRVLVSSADVIHCHDVFFWYLPFKFLFLNKPVYTTFHGYEDYPISKKAILIRKVSEKLSSGTICVGDFMKKWYGTRPNFVTYGGVNSVNGKKLRAKSLNGAVFIGRLDEQTGIKMYIDAVKLIKRKFPEFEFLVIGDGKFGKEIKKNVSVLGFRRNPERYFKNHRFAFVSRYLSILEAMLEKRLVFSVYDNPLKKDYLSLTPFSKFINIIGSSDELYSQVLFFLNNPRGEKIMIDKAFKWAKNQTWEEMANIYFRLWSSIY